MTKNTYTVTKNTYTVTAFCLTLILTLGFVETPGVSAAIEDGHQGHHRALSRRHRAVRKKTAPRRAVSYTCPMHPDILSNSPGTCPKCLMELVRQDARPAKRKQSNRE